jgi:ABC-type multidrug transport system ATPase subunit
MLSVRDLIKVYPGPVAAVRGVDLELGPGLFGLLGPNGAGKTTLMKMLATLLEPTAGNFSLDEIDGVEHPEEVRRRLGYLPQDFGFYPNVTARTMLDYLASLKGLRRRGRRAYVRRLLEQVNLADHARRKLGAFSGGMRQRFGIAQALIGAPDFLIVDEPTAGLDPQERVRFYNLLGELLDSIRGRVFEGFVPAADVEGVAEAWPVASSVVSGEEKAYRVRVVLGHTGATPPPGFHAVEASLEDGYFATGLRARAEV